MRGPLSRSIGYHVARRTGRVSARPLNLTFSVTYRCNATCRTCNVWKKRVDDLTLVEYERVFAALGRSLYWATFSGGEPFIRPDLIDIVIAVVLVVVEHDQVLGPGAHRDGGGVDVAGEAAVAPLLLVLGRVGRVVEQDAGVAVQRERLGARPLVGVARVGGVHERAAVLLEAVGVPRELFTATFTVGRMAGWAAHVMEQRAEDRLIRPQSEYVGPLPG